jgi:allophanate hydrolase subunit 1
LILAEREGVTYRYAGDRALLVEYGEMVLDLTLNFRVQAVVDALRARPVEGLVETAPGFRSILLSYEPARVRPDALVEHLDRIHDDLQALSEIPSRLANLPIAFDDAESRRAVQRYLDTIRPDAPNAKGGTNVDYVVRYNGFADPEALYQAVLATEQWVGFIGFFPGLPFMFPLDPRETVFVPKYNPSRTWTPEGAVGLGGPCYSIYPVESAGGYQLLGRTLPVYDLAGRNAIFRDDPLLLRPGDRVRFHRVEEDELLALFADVRADRYRFDRQEGVFDVAAYLEWLPSVADEAAERRAARERSAAETPVP